MPAYLVAWKAPDEGDRFIDAGIYSEPCPTPKKLGVQLPSEVLLAYAGSYHEAVERLRKRIEYDAAFSWVMSMPSYQDQFDGVPTSPAITASSLRNRSALS